MLAEVPGGAKRVCPAPVSGADLDVIPKFG